MNEKFFSKANRVIHREFLDPLFIRLFGSPEEAICCYYNCQPAISAEMIISNYYQGMLLFGSCPCDRMLWYRNDDLYWQMFPNRLVLLAEDAQIPKKLRQKMRKECFDIKFNMNFDTIIRACRRKHDTWINEQVIELYSELYEKGYVNTVEVYQDQNLVGGMWGLLIGKTFCGLSAFHTVKNAGSIAFAHLVNKLIEGEISMIDMVTKKAWQGYQTIMISREQFMRYLIRFSV